jgi:diguanylate cyclase (GGDEF)-like protein
MREKSKNRSVLGRLRSGPTTLPIFRNVALTVGAFLLLIFGVLAAVKIATDHLLYQSAATDAQSWAGFLAKSVTDLEQIAAGELPSATSMSFFQWVQKSDQVFHYEIFNREGFSQLVADHTKVTLLTLSTYSAAAARSAATAQPVIEVEESKSAEQPSFFARAYVPIVVNQHLIAVVAAYVDQTNDRDQFHQTFLLAGVSLCLLTGMAFSIPAIALYRRTKEKQYGDRRIRFLAHHDALTGLENRPSLVEKLHTAFAALPVRGGNFAVHFIDIDRFKDVNDSLGHDGGDFLLTTVAGRLRAVTRLDDVVARLGGDEFVVIQSHVGKNDEAHEFANRLTVALTEPTQFNENTISTTVSVGVALAPADGNSPERLLKSADLALYKAKADGRNCVRTFTPEMDSDLLARIALEKTIRDAVLHNRFELHYQPLFEMSGRRLIGFEALVRLRSEDGRLIPPLTFIPVAEDMRLIDKIGAWVLREACRTAATWPEHLTVAVNLSPAQFLAGSVGDVVAAILKDSGLAAHRLELEITESLLLGSTEAIMAELQALKAMGVAIVMDDFGTGYSSLSYLWRFPFDKIKIDRSFMQGLDGADRDAETVVKTIIALGRELKMRVTVEGVETARQAEFLDKANGDQAQGYYFGRPVPASEVAATILSDFAKTLPKQSSATAHEVQRRLGGPRIPVSMRPVEAANVRVRK